MSENKNSGADSAAVGNAEPVASNQLSHAEELEQQKRVVFEMTNRFIKADTAQMAIDRLVALAKVDALCSIQVKMFETGNTASQAIASGSVPSEAPKP